MTTLMLCWEFHSQSFSVALSLTPPIHQSAQAANTIFGDTVVITFKAQTHNQQRTCLNLSKSVKTCQNLSKPVKTCVTCQTVVHHKVSYMYTSKYQHGQVRYKTVPCIISYSVHTNVVTDIHFIEFSSSYLCIKYLIIIIIIIFECTRAAYKTSTRNCSP